MYPNCHAAYEKSLCFARAQIQEHQDRSTASAAKHDSVLQQLRSEQARSLELSSQVDQQHSTLRQHAGILDAARQQHNALAAELAAIQQEMTQLQIVQWQPILAAFDQQLEVRPGISITAEQSPLPPLCLLPAAREGILRVRGSVNLIPKACHGFQRQQCRHFVSGISCHMPCRQSRIS